MITARATVASRDEDADRDADDDRERDRDEQDGDGLHRLLPEAEAADQPGAATSSGRGPAGGSLLGDEADSNEDEPGRRPASSARPKERIVQGVRDRLEDVAVADDQPRESLAASMSRWRCRGRHRSLGSMRPRCAPPRNRPAVAAAGRHCPGLPTDGLAPSAAVTRAATSAGTHGRQTSAAGVQELHGRVVGLALLSRI